MCRKLASAATALMLPLLIAGAALADSRPAAAPAQAAPPRASAAERAAAERMDALGRAAFWAAQVNADPRDADAGVKLAAALRALGRDQEAYDAAAQVLVIQPDNIEALLETARVAIADGQGFFAVAPALRAEKLAPKDWRGPTLLGVAYEQTSRPADALAAHRLAVKLAPDNPTVLSNMAMFYAGQGDRAQAEALLRHAASRPDAPLQVRQNLALILGLEGKMAEAEQIQRQDLPPQMVANNLAYLKAASDAGAPVLGAAPAVQTK
jgi:Flp pilus assembly protein TadD